ncbi:MAG: DUF559 domain-containing protein [FCB group bacterium]|jgi:very-short-patch-repair endonuclease
MPKNDKNVLIALIPNPRDLGIAFLQHWYRIPASTKIVPASVKNKTLEIIAFYQPSEFKEDAFKIQSYGEVKNIEIVPRKELFPKERKSPKEEKLYYKIVIKKLLELDKPILSLRHRRILFINSTIDKFKDAKEINDLFYESPLEVRFWDSFKIDKILAERQFYKKFGKDRFVMDFAIFCKDRKLDVECDSDTYHMNKQIVQKDKKRDNILQSYGWNVLRYTSDDINNNFTSSIMQVRDTIKHYGGLSELIDED